MWKCTQNANSGTYTLGSDSLPHVNNFSRRDQDIVDMRWQRRKEGEGKQEVNMSRIHCSLYVIMKIQSLILKKRHCRKLLFSISTTPTNFHCRQSLHHLSSAILMQALFPCHSGVLLRVSRMHLLERHTSYLLLKPFTSFWYTINFFSLTIQFL